MATNLSFQVQPCPRSNPSAPHSAFVQTVIAARPLRADAGTWWPGAAFRGLCSFVREQVAVGPSRTPTYLTRLHCLQLNTKHTRVRCMTATGPCFPPRADRSSSQASETTPEPLAKPTPASSCPQLVRESPNCVSRLDSALGAFACGMPPCLVAPVIWRCQDLHVTWLVSWFHLPYGYITDSGCACCVYPPRHACNHGKY